MSSIHVVVSVQGDCACNECVESVVEIVIIIPKSNVY